MTHSVCVPDSASQVNGGLCSGLSRSLAIVVGEGNTSYGKKKHQPARFLPDVRSEKLDKVISSPV